MAAKAIVGWWARGERVLLGICFVVGLLGVVIGCSTETARGGAGGAGGASASGGQSGSGGSGSGGAGGDPAGGSPGHDAASGCVSLATGGHGGGDQDASSDASDDANDCAFACGDQTCVAGVSYCLVQGQSGAVGGHDGHASPDLYSCFAYSASCNDCSCLHLSAGCTCSGFAGRNTEYCPGF